MAKHEWVGWGILIFIGLLMIYMLLGLTGLLPQSFYDKCDPDKHSVEERVKMGCCENISEPELLFGMSHACSKSIASTGSLSKQSDTTNG